MWQPGHAIALRERWGDADEWDGLVEFQRELGARGWSAPAWPIEIGGRALGRRSTDTQPGASDVTPRARTRSAGAGEANE